MTITYDSPPIEREGLEREANRLFDLGDYETAERMFERLLRDGESAWCTFQYGRVAARLGHWEEAVERFDRALAAPRPIPWSHYERGVANSQLRRTDKALVPDLLRFIEQPPAELNTMHFSVLLRAAHAAFDNAESDAASQIYDFVHRSGQADYMCLLRRADLALSRGDDLRAVAILEDCETHSDYNYWGDFLRGRAHFKIGEIGTAIEFFEKAVSSAPDNIGFWNALFQGFAKSNIDISTVLEHTSSTPHRKNINKIIFLSSLYSNNYDGLNRTTNLLSKNTAHELSRYIVDFINSPRPLSDVGVIESTLESIKGKFFDSSKIVCAGLHFYFRAKDWTKAARLISQSEVVLDDLGDSDFRVCKLEYLCFTLQHNQALDYLTTRIGRKNLPESGTSVVAALYAALNQWKDVLDFIEERVSDGFAIKYEPLLEALAHATRRTKGYAQALTILDRALEGGKDPLLTNRKDHLAEELHLLALLDRQSSGVTGTDMPGFSNRVRKQRVDILTKTLRPRHLPQGTVTVYFCCDLNYILGVSVALYSFLRSNIGTSKRYQFRAYVSDDALPLAESILGGLAAAFAVNISIRPSSALIEREHTFRAGWGLFTPGHSLSNAAYYRIYVARELLREGVDGRALYLDADTLVAWGTEELVTQELQNKPLGACRELPLAEIFYAADKLGVSRDFYFNSGVLLFDLSHPALPDALSVAIDMAANNHDKLTFLDQCALNFAFNGQTTLLPKKFNYFVRHSSKLTHGIQEPTVWHFLDRPKPWDPMYPSKNCTRWLREFASFGDIVGTENLRRLMALQFPRDQDDGAE